MLPAHWWKPLALDSYRRMPIPPVKFQQHIQNKMAKIEQETCVLTRFNKIAIPNNKFQMANGQGSHWIYGEVLLGGLICT